MDGEAFDRLSVAVHRLRGQATRRNAIRLLFGGAAVATAGLLGEETDARRRKRNKKRKKCRGYGGRCDKSKDCCNGKCRNGICWYTGGGGGGGGGGKHCGGRRCGNGLKCCRYNGIDLCLPHNDVRCRDHDVCPGGWDHCGWYNGIRQCCGSNQRCCGNGRCCPDLPGWHCGDIACEYWQDAEISGEADETTPYEDPIPVDAIDPAEFA